MTIKGADGTTQTGSGNMQETIGQGTLGGQQVLTDEVQFGALFPDGIRRGSSSKTYFEQDSQGDYQELGEDKVDGSGTLTATQPQTIFPGYWQNAPSSDVTLTFDDGSTKHMTMTVTPGSIMQTSTSGQQTECWVVDGVTSGSNSPNSEIKGLFSPSMGQMVQSTYTSSGGAEGDVTLTASLTSVNLVASGQ
jgi:hypothetical protein